MKEDKTQVEKQINKAEPVRTGDLDKAIERIYKKYGSDLQAFFRDANKEATHSRPDSDALKSFYCD